MGRLAREVEFIRLLRELEGFSDVVQWAKACGKAPANMSNYLSGKLTPRRAVLRTCLQHLHEWPVKPLLEVARLPSNLSTLPKAPGIYILYDSAGNVLYVGKAANFRAEVRQTLSRRVPKAIRLGPTLRKAQPKLAKLCRFVSLYSVPSERLRHNLEAMFLRTLINQTHNTNIGTFQ